MTLMAAEFDMGCIAANFRKFVNETDITLGDLAWRLGHAETRPVREILDDRFMIKLEWVTLMRFVMACRGIMTFNLKGINAMRSEKLEMEKDIINNLRIICTRAKKAIADSGLTVEEIAVAMDLPSPGAIEVVALTGSVERMHMRTLVRLFRACGYSVGVTFTRAGKDTAEGKKPKASEEALKTKRVVKRKKAAK